MEPIRTIRLHWAHGALRDVTVLERSFSTFAPHPWQPAINAYRCRDAFRICVDLAGVEKADIDLQIEPHRLVVRGEREVPEPRGQDGEVLQTLAMEIDYGPFLRVVKLPAEIDIEKTTAGQENGLLWINLPVNKS